MNAAAWGPTLTRRDLLAGAASLAAAPFLPKPVPAATCVTSSAVAPGARLRRRKNSCRGLSHARCSPSNVSADGAAR